MPESTLLPKLAAHWEELTKETIEECTFHGIEAYNGWIIVDERHELDKDIMDEGKRR